jgi:uncharacterized protein
VDQPVSLRPEVVETHISVVFFVGDRAYKLKKPVVFDFLDYSTRAARERACHREVELNRRLAPDIYRGVADVSGPDGEVCDHLVVMTRLPNGRRLARLVQSAATEVDAQLDAVADLIVRFHADADRNPTIDAAAAPGAVAALWDTNLSELRHAAAKSIDTATIDLADRLARRFLVGRDRLLQHRIDAGCICDGHGDLQADDIFCLPDGPRVLDCIDFDDRLRYGDVVSDVAFLAMDLERLGAPDAATHFVNAYEESSGQRFPPTLLHFYIAYRALVRSKVHLLRSREGLDTTSVDVAASLLDLAIEHLDRATVRLILVGGLPGTGKSSLAHELAATIGATVLGSDSTRKDISGVPRGERHTGEFEDDLYTPERTDLVYDALITQARDHLEQGRTVVLDASWRAERHRRAARSAAHGAAADLVELRCEVPADLAAERIRRRLEGPTTSDATPAIAAAMAASFDRWDEGLGVDTTRPVEECLPEIVEALRSRP